MCRLYLAMRSCVSGSMPKRRLNLASADDILRLGRAIFEIRLSDISEFVEDAGRADSISQKSLKTSLSSATARLDFWKPGTTFVLPRQLRFCRTDAALAASAALLLVPLHRDCGDLSKLSHAKSGKHYRSDPVRVQSTIVEGCVISVGS